MSSEQSERIWGVARERRQLSRIVVRSSKVIVVALAAMGCVSSPSWGAQVDLFVSSDFHILRYDGQTGAFIESFASDGVNRPNGMDIGPDGNLYVANATFDNILRIDWVTGDTLGSFDSATLNYPNGLAFGSDGLLYVSSTASDEVLRYDGVTGTFVDTFIDEFNTPGSPKINDPADLKFGTDGYLYVGGDDVVARYNITTGEFLGYAAEGVFSAGTSFDFGPDGDLYVTSFWGENVRRFDGATGADLGVFASEGGLDTPSGLTFGPDGHLYVTSLQTDQILRYNGTTGEFIDVFADGGGINRATNIMFFQIPEPSTFALAAVGLFGLALIGRKRVGIPFPRC